MNYEYCVMHYRFPDEPHRGPWTRQKCQEWIDDCLADGMKQGVFYIARRAIGEWETL